LKFLAIASSWRLSVEVLEVVTRADEPVGDLDVERTIDEPDAVMTSRTRQS
jgi:hypothetical protein